MRRNPRDRFFEKIEKTSSCWIWKGGKNEKGYGTFFVQSYKACVKAHRFSYEILIGKIPSGMCVLHRCDTPSCVNPDHLFIGTQQDNLADMRAKGRARQGHLYGDEWRKAHAGSHNRNKDSRSAKAD